VGQAGVNSYDGIGAGGKGDRTLKLITGLDTARDGLEAVGGVAAGELQVATTKDEVPSYLAPHHVYAIVKYDASRGEVTLFNPWGLHGANKQVKYGRFTMSWNDFWTAFRDVDHVKRRS
jgi:hypothetical protein